MPEQQRITVLGLGNVLLGDEGFGVHFVEWFKKRWQLPERVSVLDGGVLGYRLLDTVTECEHLIAVDVLKVSDAPGSVYRFTLEELQARLPAATSAHEVEFPHVLLMAELMDSAPAAVFVCVVPECIGETTDLNPALAARFELVEDLVLAELRRLAVHPVRRDA